MLNISKLIHQSFKINRIKLFIYFCILVWHEHWFTCVHYKN
jgi:hypothetical protein